MAQARSGALLSEGKLVDHRTPFLSIITVVFNDLPGLLSTIQSVDPYRGEDLEHWIIDGSSNDEIRRHFDASLPMKTHLLSEPDEGLYDAMNKGLDRAAGDYALFINAGDLLVSGLRLRDIEASAEAIRPAPLVLGYTIESWKGDRFLRPGLGREHNVLTAPPHQATFYPHHFYRDHRYSLLKNVGADGDFTRAAAGRLPVVFVPQVICDFALGGRSTSYDASSVRLRFRSSSSASRRAKTVARAKTLVKRALWLALPRRWFYRVTAIGKFSRLRQNDPALLPTPIRIR